MKTFALPWGLLVGLPLWLSISAATGDARRWHDPMPPVPGAPRSIGSYTSGCLQGAQALPSTGPGFQTMRRSRQRFFGHPNLIQYVAALGQMVHQEGLGILSIGDLGQARGGPIPSAHRSHQTGLDVDIWFWLQPASRSMPPADRETAQPPSMVSHGRLALHPKGWTSRQMRLMEAAASFENVERIFVTPPVKQALCKAFPGAAWLGKVRPWWGHRAHFHVRLSCPKDDAACLKQAPLPQGDGCDATLDWWFSGEAQHPPRGKSKQIPLPEACRAILAQ